MIAKAEATSRVTESELLVSESELIVSESELLVSMRLPSIPRPL